MRAKSDCVARVIWGLIGATVTFVAFLGYMVTAGKKIQTFFVDQVTISHTVQVIYSYKHTLFGMFSPPRGRLVRLYIHPHDGVRPLKFWMQSPVTEAGGSWQLEARFGNPFWHDMVGRSPLKYDVFAGLFKRGTDIPGSNPGAIEIGEGVDFEQWLRRNGATSVAKTQVTRVRDKGCSFLPQIINPPPPADPHDKPRVGPHIRLSWKPNRRLWVELWRHSKEVPQYRHDFYENNLDVVLDTGIYELKVKEIEESHCEASVWFEVVNSP